MTSSDENKSEIEDYDYKPSWSLALPKEIAMIYSKEMALQRRKLLQWAVPLGLFIYSLYGIVDYVSLSDDMAYALTIRLGGAALWLVIFHFYMEFWDEGELVADVLEYGLCIACLLLVISMLVISYAKPLDILTIYSHGVALIVLYFNIVLMMPLHYAGFCTLGGILSIVGFGVFRIGVSEVEPIEVIYLVDLVGVMLFGLLANYLIHYNIQKYFLRALKLEVEKEQPKKQGRRLGDSQGAA